MKGDGGRPRSKTNRSEQQDKKKKKKKKKRSHRIAKRSPLVKAGQIAESHVRVLDDVLLPDDVPVLLMAQRFVADAPELLQRSAPIGARRGPTTARLRSSRLDRSALADCLVFPF